MKEIRVLLRVARSFVLLTGIKSPLLAKRGTEMRVARRRENETRKCVCVCV